MSKKYELTKQIHEILTQINKKYGLNIEIKGEYIYKEMLTKDKTVDDVYLQHLHPDFFSDVVVEGKLMSWDSYKILPVIQAPQIKQILFGLKDVLGESDDWKSAKLEMEEDGDFGDLSNIIYDKSFFCVYNIKYNESIIYGSTKSQAEALCAKWIDGLTPLIESEPEKVLEELKETLTKML
jgi:hypothetical protein